MSISKDVIKQCLISKQREVDEAIIVNRPVVFEEDGNREGDAEEILLHRQRTAEPVLNELRDVVAGEHGGGGVVQAVWQEECVFPERREGD